MLGNRDGLTLLEVVLAVAILALLMGTAYGVLFGTLVAQDQISASLAADRIGTRVLSVIAGDLAAVVTYTDDEMSTFEVEVQRGRVSVTKSVQFVTTNQSILPDGERSSPVNEVGYVLEANADRPGFFRLFRREDFFVDKAPTSGGQRILLHDLVERFQITWHGHEEGKPAKTDWDVDQDEGFPRAAEILLFLAVEVGPPASAGAEKARPISEVYHFKTRATLLSRAPEEAEDEEDGEEGGGGDTASDPETLGPEDVEGTGGG